MNLPERPKAQGTQSLKLLLPLLAGSAVGWIVAGQVMLPQRHVARPTNAAPQRERLPPQPVPASVTGLWQALEKDGAINSPNKLQKEVGKTVEKVREADGTSPFELALKQLLDFDPKLAAEMYRMQDQLFSNVNVLACGGNEARAHDGGTFVLNGIAMLDVRCANGSCKVADLQLASEGNQSSVGSDDFERCLRKAAGQPFKCPDCKEGNVAVQWPLRHGFGQMSDEDMKALLDSQ